jgi:hypothetical protein
MYFIATGEASVTVLNKRAKNIEKYLTLLPGDHFGVSKDTLSLGNWNDHGYSSNCHH